MTIQDILVQKILGSSRSAGRGTRVEVEAELASHIEDLVEEARAAGAKAQRGIRSAVEPASGRAAGRCLSRSRASESDVQCGGLASGARRMYIW